MKNAIIYVFSGTGNTKKACDIYKNEFEKNIKSALDMMKKLKNKDLDNEWKNRILFPLI